MSPPEPTIDIINSSVWWCEIKFCALSDIIILFAITKEVSNLNTRPWGCVYSPWTWALPSVCRGETLWFLAATLGLRCDPCSGMDWFLFCYHTLIYTTLWRNLTCLLPATPRYYLPVCSQLILTDTYIQGGRYVTLTVRARYNCKSYTLSCTQYLLPFRRWQLSCTVRSSVCTYVVFAIDACSSRKTQYTER